MPFNETNDYTSSWWQEESDTSLSCSQGCCSVEWDSQAGVRSGSQHWGTLAIHLCMACDKRCLPQVLGEQVLWDTECGLLGMSNCCWGVCGSKATEKLNRIGCLLLLEALLSPICCILLLSAIFFLSSPFNVFHSIVLHPYFLSVFVYCCFFPHACPHCFSLPKS